MTATLRRTGLPRPVVGITVGAIALRLLLFVGRGDYVAFDEGWYLLLGRNLMSGEGYTLSGLRHVTLSPLFPILAGALGAVLGNIVWAGRVVAALAAGLLVLPCWSIFRRLAGRRTALLGCGLVAVMPALAPFVVPFWIGWDLWVGAEPLLHLFLYSGIAVALRAWELGRARDWVLSGSFFALAYLARPEAVIPFGLLGLAAGVTVLLVRRAPRRLLQPAAFALAFAVVAAPYGLYLRDALGRWALTGRSVENVWASRDRPVRAAGGAAATIERMLWDDEEGDYLRKLYSLDASGLRLASPYWGVPPRDGAPRAQAPTGAQSSRAPGPAGGASGARAPTSPTSDAGAGPRLARYARALGVLVPFYLWPLVALGLLVPRRRWRAELLALGPIFATSALIAAVVAADPRTQSLVLPALAFYAARGVRLLGVFADRYRGRTQLRRRFVGTALAAIVLLLLLGADARRLYMSLSVGSPHHVLGSGKRQVGAALRTIVPEGEPVMSWHPAIALYADREWRVLPLAELDRIVRYADAADCRTLVPSAFHPSPWPIADWGYEYVILRLDPAAAAAEAWRIEWTEAHDRYAVGWLRPA